MSEPSVTRCARGLMLESNIVDMSFMFINLMKDGSYELFDETHRIRLFTFPEMSQILAQNGFEVVQGYNWDQNKSDLKPFARDLMINDGFQCF